MSYTIAVRALCEFTAKCGDLDLRFTPGPTAQDGIQGHATVRGRRKAAYQAEVSLEGEFAQVRVRGRADGYDPESNRVEEIKTYRGDLAKMPDNHRQLHWAQAKIYGHLLCQKLELSNITVALVYYEIGEQTESVLAETYSAMSLRQFFEEQCALFQAWAEQETQHRLARDQALLAMTFPHPEFRAGQRELAQAIYKAATKACGVMVQAPTGIGKTVGTLFPLLKAVPVTELDKVFYLAAKTSGRQLALDALDLIRRQSPQLALRVVELVARDKACEYPDKACHGDSCPLAKSFYDRLPDARQAMLKQPSFDKSALREVALEHQVCPYYLSQEMVRWSDVVVGDYNYYFDVSAMLYGMTSNNQWKVGVLVDEAHNMVERARKMYSAELKHFTLKALRKNGPAELQASLTRLNRSWNALCKTQEAGYQVYPSIPDEFVLALQKTSAAIADYLALQPAVPNPDLQGFYFDLLLFVRLAESFGDHSLFDITLVPGSTSRRHANLCIRNVVPAPFLKQRFAAAHTTTLFSATLSPWQYYSDLLGMPPDTPWIEVQSPFHAKQLRVNIVPKISTRYKDRADSLRPIAELMANQFQTQPGNYLAFFSSFEYLQNVLLAFRQLAPEVPIWEQSRSMDEQAKTEFLEKFTADSQGIGFAVLGGAFAEGIDLPGARLIGAFIATLGLPQINPVNEQIKMRMDASFGAGYDYAYLYPGLQKVVQAAGRVIRTNSDEGIIYLIDDRYTRHEVKQLLPAWWHIDTAMTSHIP